MKGKSYNVELPWPPSINNYWRCTRQGIWYVTHKGRDYKRQVVEIIERDRLAKGLSGRLAVSLQFFPPSSRDVDIDNYVKPLFDALESAKLFLNDNQIDYFSANRRRIIANGRVDVYLYQFTRPESQRFSQLETRTEILL